MPPVPLVTVKFHGFGVTVKVRPRGHDIVLNPVDESRPNLPGVDGATGLVYVIGNVAVSVQPLLVVQTKSSDPLATPPVIPVNVKVVLHPKLTKPAPTLHPVPATVPTIR